MPDSFPAALEGTLTSKAEDKFRVLVGIIYFRYSYNLTGKNRIML